MMLPFLKSYSFEWDEAKNKANQEKHGVSFEEAQHAFNDTSRIIIKDTSHSLEIEDRYFCLGKIQNDVCTVRFVIRKDRIRIFGAGFWRKEKARYERKNKNK